jgi:cbb3-type cytochrome c oxidase subunit III
VKPELFEGRIIFQENCAECHRNDGRGGGSVPRLQAYPAGADKRFIQTVLAGRNELGMPPWGGLLTEVQARAVLEYVRALVPTVEMPASAPQEEQARQVFSQVCATCHGARGAGTRLAPSLQAFRGSDAEFVKAVLDGRPGTAMAPFKNMVSVEVALKILEYVRDLWR